MIKNEDMNIKNIDEQIKEIDKQIRKIEKEERENPIKYEKKEEIDQSEEAINTIKECVNEILEIDNLEEDRQNNSDNYNNRMLTIVSWFMYLKRKKLDSKEYNEAVELIKNIGIKHNTLSSWCNDLINKNVDTNESVKKINLINIVSNVSDNNEYVVNDNLKIVFDLDNVKSQANDNKQDILVNSSNKKYIFNIIYNNEVFSVEQTFDNLQPKNNLDDSCPVNVIINNEYKDENSKYFVDFNVIEK